MTEFAWTDATEVEANRLYIALNLSGAAVADRIGGGCTPNHVKALVLKRKWQKGVGRAVRTARKVTKTAAETKVPHAPRFVPAPPDQPGPEAATMGEIGIREGLSQAMGEGKRLCLWPVGPDVTANDAQLFCGCVVARLVPSHKGEIRRALYCGKHHVRAYPRGKAPAIFKG